MYETHFKLETKPFSLSPDPRFLFFSKRHAQAYAMLEYGVREQVGFAVVTGEVGAGKTTLLRKLLAELDDECNVALVSHTHPNLNSTIPAVLDAFGVMVDELPVDESMQYRFFVDFLLEQYRRGRRSVLIIDEAQNLSASALEQLRLLSNVNADGHLLLQTILIGQPELRELLKKPELRQFAQRISVDYFLPKLGHKEALAYIDHRVSVAGGNPDIFDHNAKNLLAYVAKGLPRMINNLCDMALVYAYGEGRPRVDGKTAMSVIKDKCESGILPMVSMKELRTKMAR